MAALAHSPRPRTRRRPTGKPIKVTPRALEIFDRLDGNRTNLSNRLGDLYHENNTPPYFDWYLDRPEGQWRSMNARYVHATYINTAAAERALRDHGRDIRQKPNLSNS